MSQVFSHFSAFWHHFVLAKLATSSIRVKLFHKHSAIKTAPPPPLLWNTANTVDTMADIVGIYNKELIIIHFLRTSILGAVNALL